MLGNTTNVKRIRVLTLTDSVHRDLVCEGVKIGHTYPVVAEWQDAYRIVLDWTKFIPTSRWVSKLDVEIIESK